MHIWNKTYNNTDFILKAVTDFILKAVMDKRFKPGSHKHTNIIHSRIIRMRMTNDRDGIGLCACVSCEGLYKAETNVAAAQ